VFDWTDLRGFTIQEDGFEGMKVVWLTWFGRIDEERFVGLDLRSSEVICRDLKGWRLKLRNNPCKWSRNYEIPLTLEVDLRRWIWRDLSGLCVYERVVWINGCIVRFEGIWEDWLWKFRIDLIDVIDLFLFF